MKPINIIVFLFFCILLFRCKEFDLNPDPNSIPDKTIVDGLIVDSSNNQPITSVMVKLFKDHMNFFYNNSPFDTLYSDSIGKFYIEMQLETSDNYRYYLRFEKKGYYLVDNNPNIVDDEVSFEKNVKQNLVIRMKKN